MKYNLLGNSGLKVSNLSIGTMNYGKGDPSQPLFSLGIKEAKRNIDFWRFGDRRYFVGNFH